MYDLYNNNRWFYPVLKLIFLVLSLLMFWIGYNDLRLKGFNFSTVMSALWGGLFLFIFIVSVKAGDPDPYETIRKWKKENPSRVEDMEQDFEHSRELAYRIRKGAEYYFFKGNDFFIIPVGQIRSLQVRHLIRRRIGSFTRATFTSVDGETRIDIPHLILGKAECMDVLQSIASENGIEINLTE